MNLHLRYASADPDFNKQCRLFQRICPNLFTDFGIRGIIKARNEERKTTTAGFYTEKGLSLSTFFHK